MNFSLTAELQPWTCLYMTAFRLKSCCLALLTSAQSIRWLPISCSWTLRGTLTQTNSCWASVFPLRLPFCFDISPSAKQAKCNTSRRPVPIEKSLTGRVPDLERFDSDRDIQYRESHRPTWEVSICSTLSSTARNLRMTDCRTNLFMHSVHACIHACMHAVNHFLGLCFGLPSHEHCKNSLPCAVCL